MARVGLSNNLKFRHLVVALGGNRMLARGALELLWEPCYEVGDAYVGTSDDIEATVGWMGERGALTRALLQAGAPKGAGFIEPYEGSVRDSSARHYQIHDFFHHCPEYVKGRRERELEKTTPKMCAVCGDTFYSANASTSCCSARCRMKAVRERHKRRKARITQEVAATRSDRSECSDPAIRKFSTPAHAHVRTTDVQVQLVPVESTAVDTAVPTDPPRTEDVVEDLPDFDLQPDDDPPLTKAALLARAADTSPIVLTFPVQGTQGPVWPLRQSLIDRWTVLYPTLNVRQEVSKALAWVEAAMKRRKTYGGMERFLVAWLNRAVEIHARGPTVITGSLKTAGNKAAVEEFLRRQR